MHFGGLLFSSLLLCVPLLCMAAPVDGRTETAPAGCDSARVRFKLAEKSLRPTIYFKLGDASEKAISPMAKDVVKDAVYVEYRNRGKWEKANGPVPKKTYENIEIEFGGLGITWYCRPNPSYYNIPLPKDRLLEWERRFPDAVNTEMVLEARRENDDVAFYVNGQYAGRKPGAKLVRGVILKNIAPAGRLEDGFDDLSLEDNGPSFEIEWFTAKPMSSLVTLPSRGPAHASKKLAGGKASISLKPGLQNVGGIKMEVFNLEESIDISLNHRTCTQTSLFDNPYYTRTAYHVCPEFAQWCVPNAFYTAAWVLCADVPQAGHEPYIGTQLTRSGNLGGSALVYDRQTLDGAKEVGVLEWTDNGERKTSPLVLVRVPLSIGRIIDLVNDKPIYADGKGWKKLHKLNRTLPQVDDYLDFEFNGGGQWKTASSMHVFGVTLEKSPYGVEMVQSEFGNLFYNDEPSETGIEVTAFADNTKGLVDAIVYDEAFRILSTNTVPFEIAKAGEKKELHFDLSQKAPGWYGLDFVFRDANGEMLFTHEAAFALLGKDTREAGYDSPYAAWPHNGRHNSQPYLEEVARKMHKLGLRKSWEPPGDSEDEQQLKKYSITRSVLYSANPCGPCDANVLQKHLDGVVAEARKNLEAFPHMSKTIQLLHEQGGRELAHEMLYKPAVRGEYKGIAGSWDVYYCTEFCKRMRQEFPDFDIQIGNGSSASEKIASLCRGGFDLNLVTQLGIESKGFQTMPEECANLEAPGMLWALRETGRRFGFTNFTTNACNEYVFRPERDIPRNASRARRRAVTDFYLRDYLISLVHGVRCICTAHLEDSKTNYYDTNWGAGCTSKTYLYAYPTRCLVGIATLTKVLDCVERYPRRIPTGEVVTYAMEWHRNRNVRDFATALWTPSHDARLKVKYPQGTSVVLVGTFGAETELTQDSEGCVTVEIGSSPVYLVTSSPAEKGIVIEHIREKPEGFVKIADVNTSTVDVVPLVEKPKSFPMVGKFVNTDADDAELGTTLSAMLEKREEPLPEVVWEYEHLRFKKPIAVDPRQTDSIGIWVKGNGAFGEINIVLADPPDVKRTWSVSLGYRNKITFHGWHFLSGRTKGDQSKMPSKPVVRHIMVGSAAVALDPREMVPVTEPVGIGPILVKSGEGGNAVSELTENEALSFAVMDTVDDRDLAGKQLEKEGERQKDEGISGENGESVENSKPNAASSNAEPSTSNLPPSTPFSEDMVAFIAKENRKEGFAEELKKRVTEAWRREVASGKKEKRATSTTDDPLVLALASWVGPGLPEAKPPEKLRVKGDNATEIRELAEELRIAEPTFEVKVPDGVFSRVRRGNGGRNSITFFNLTDETASFTLWVPKDTPTKFMDLKTGKVWSSPTHGWYGFTLKPREAKILRSNSGLPFKKEPAIDGMLILDE